MDSTAGRATSGNNPISMPSNIQPAKAAVSASHRPRAAAGDVPAASGADIRGEDTSKGPLYRLGRGTPNTPHTYNFSSPRAMRMMRTRWFTRPQKEETAVIHFPLLRWGQPYKSLDVDQVVHFS